MCWLCFNHTHGFLSDITCISPTVRLHRMQQSSVYTVTVWFCNIFDMSQFCLLSGPSMSPSPLNSIKHGPCDSMYNCVHCVDLSVFKFLLTRKLCIANLLLRPGRTTCWEIAPSLWSCSMDSWSHRSGVWSVGMWAYALIHSPTYPCRFLWIAVYILKLLVSWQYIATCSFW